MQCKTYPCAVRPMTPQSCSVLVEVFRSCHPNAVDLLPKDGALACELVHYQPLQPAEIWLEISSTAQEHYEKIHSLRELE